VGASANSGGYVVPERYWAWLGTRRAAAVLLWMVTLGVATYHFVHCWIWFGNRVDQPDSHRRADGNAGHAQIDFGGQWVMGRMVVEGHGRELYHRQRQWDVVRRGFPVEDEPPVNRAEWHLPGSRRTLAKTDDDLRHDADKLMGWFMGADPSEWRAVGGAAVTPLAQGPFANPLASAVYCESARQAVTLATVEAVTRPAVGGPLYPPVHGFLYAPLGALRPLQAYHTFQVVALLMTFLAGLGVRILSRGRIWWSAATLVLLLYPGTRGGLDLAQNPSVTLAIAVWGWALAARGYNTAGGVVWGLFAFKPVWALALCIVPFLTRRWRFCTAMVVTGVGLCAATVPFVGIQTWLDWLAVGKEAAALYNVNQNWITLSRDLQSVPRRMLHDFSLPEAERDTALAKTLAWVLWGTVFVATVGVYLRFADHRRATGVGAGFLFFGAWLTCYRFMYYDSLVSAVACAVLFAEPATFFRTIRFAILPRPWAPAMSGARGIGSPGTVPRTTGALFVGYLSSFPLTILALLLFVENSLRGMAIEGTLGFGYYARVTTSFDGVTGRSTPRLVWDTSTSYPWETFLILLMWGWCGWRLLRGEERTPGRGELSGAT
jgi:arabinofuranan 3-O-arabinosyltransferase